VEASEFLGRFLQRFLISENFPNRKRENQWYRHRRATRGQLVAIAIPKNLLAAYTYSQNTLKNTMLKRVVKAFSQS